jgi:nitrate reductase delta subunit
MGIYACIAEALKYPDAESKKRLLALSGSLDIEARPGFLDFLEQVNQIDLYQWEELYTRTWDLQPAVAPYIGYQIWGDSYPRGEFMSRLNREMAGFHIDMEGELPDHLIPVLRYLDVASEPVPDLLPNLQPALKSMRHALKKADPENPYLCLLDVLLVQVVRDQKVKPAES